MAKPIVADAFVKKWAEALHIDPNECHRIIIEATVGDVLRIYVSKVGTEDMLLIEPPDVQDVKVTVV